MESKAFAALCETGQQTQTTNNINIRTINI